MKKSGGWLFNQGRTRSERVDGLIQRRTASARTMQTIAISASECSIQAVPKRSCTQPSDAVIYTTGRFPREESVAYFVEAAPRQWRAGRSRRPCAPSTHRPEERSMLLQLAKQKQLPSKSRRRFD